MHEILKRALDEALTSVYAEALSAEALSAEAEEQHVFSAAFEKKMRALIRKTDHFYQKYTRILAAAACAMIAVGCAVLLPQLLANRVNVQQPESVTASDTAGIMSEGKDTSDETTTNTSDETTTNASDEITTDDSDEIAMYDEDEIGSDEAELENLEDSADGAISPIMPSAVPNGDSVSAPEEEIADTRPAESAGNGASGAASDQPAAEIPAAADAPESAVEEDEPDEKNDDAFAEPADVDGSPVTGVGDDDIDVGDDDESDDDNDVDDSDDDDAVSIEDSDDDDVSDDYDEDISDDGDVGSLTTAGNIPMEKTLGEEVRALIGCGLSETYLHGGFCRVDGKQYDLPLMEGIPAETYRDAALAKLLESAERTELPTEIGEVLLYAELGSAPPYFNAPDDYDFSVRKRYSSMYFGGEDVDENDEVDTWDEEAGDIIFQVNRNGIVKIISVGYDGIAYYRLGDEALKQITERLNARFQTSEPQKVGDLGALLGSSENYARVYVRIDRYYDCTMGGNLSDGSFLEKLLQKYGETKLSGEKPRKGSAVIMITVVSRETLRRVSLDFYADGTVQTEDGRTFTVKQSEVRGILKEYCRQKKLAEPVFYKTLGEYIPDKNFTRVNSARLRGGSTAESYDLDGENAEKTLEKIRRLIVSRAGESAYLPERRTFSDRSDYVLIWLDGWGDFLEIDKDVIRIGGTMDVFEAPEGLYEEICGLIRSEGISFVDRVVEWEDVDEGCLG